MIKFKVYKHDDKQFYFSVHDNGKSILDSGPYPTKAETCTTIEILWFKIAKAQDHPDAQGCTSTTFEIVRPVPYLGGSLHR